jgi:hypothetical protein
LEQQQSGANVRVFVVWEPVLPTDWSAPSTSSLKRVSDSRAQQYWDKGRLLSKAMGEKDRSSVVWDSVGLYNPGVKWDSETPPVAQFQDGPVVRVIPGFTDALRRAITSEPQSRGKLPQSAMIP